MSNPTQDHTSRHILQFVFHGAQALDITGPLEVFSLTNEFLANGSARLNYPYKIDLIAEKSGPVTLSSGLRLVPNYCLESPVETPCFTEVDTFLIPGGNGVQAVRENDTVLSFIRHQSTIARRLASVCSGTFLLAQAGLLEGKTVTTHWQVSSRLAHEFPTLQVEPDLIFTRDGNIYTSAGITAGIDLALCLVEEDYGRKVSLAVAKELVVYMKRQGGQSQFSSALNLQHASPTVLGDIISWIRANPTADLSIQNLASLTRLSERHFSRKFKTETGFSPGVFVEKVRVEHAAKMLENSSDGLKSIAADCGFSSEEMMRRSFKRQLNVLPNFYRQRFGK